MNEIEVNEIEKNVKRGQNSKTITEDQTNYETNYKINYKINYSTQPTSFSIFIEDIKQCEMSHKRIKPDIKEEFNTYNKYRNLCDKILTELSCIEKAMPPNISDDTKLPDETLENIIEIEDILEDIYDLEWGKKECLNRIIVAIQSQINNIDWTYQHVKFLKQSFTYLIPRYSITEDSVQEILKIIGDYKFDIFRGTISSSNNLKKRYKIIEIE